MISMTPAAGLPGMLPGAAAPASATRAGPAEDSLAAFTRLLTRLAQPAGDTGGATVPADALAARRAPRALDDALAPEDVWASIWFASTQAVPAPAITDAPVPVPTTSEAGMEASLSPAALAARAAAGAGLPVAREGVALRERTDLAAPKGLAIAELNRPQPVLAETPAPLHANAGPQSALAGLLPTAAESRPGEMSPSEILAMVEQARAGADDPGSVPSLEIAAVQSEASDFAHGLSALGAPSAASGRESGAVAPPQTLDLRLPQAPAQLAQSIVWHLDQGLQEVSIDLHPVELGRMEIHLKLEGERVDLRFDMADSQVQDVVKTSLPQLASLLSARGLMLDQAQVFTQSRQGGGNGRAQDREVGDSQESAPSPVSGVRTIRRGLVDDYV